ncbi:MAG: FtsQ-type POTRA domain-containing protein [Ruminococcus sp.]|nr:FtsQ-type POTRA domain-containing protein [Ruminococcus sp.]
MKDVEKISVERQNSRKRIRRRNRMMNVYGLVVILLVITAAVTISYTFLFNVDKIKVSGESDMYTAEDIVNASGIRKGDNLLRMKSDVNEQAILDRLLYVETAEISKKFPTSVEINVTRCIPAFNIKYDEGTLLVSKKGKILADNGYITDKLPVIYGYDPADTTPGRPLVSKNEHKGEAFEEIISAFTGNIDYKISSVDMSDEFSIIVNYENGIVFKMGNWSEVEYKLNLAKTVMEDETVRGKKGFLTMIRSNEISFRDTDKPADVPGIVEPTKPPATDENGNPINEELNPEQEDIFNDFNANNNNNNDQQQNGLNGENVGGGYNNSPDYNNDVQNGWN